MQQDIFSAAFGCFRTSTVLNSGSKNLFCREIPDDDKI